MAPQIAIRRVTESAKSAVQIETKKIRQLRLINTYGSQKAKRWGHYWYGMGGNCLGLLGSPLLHAVKSRADRYV